LVHCGVFLWTRTALHRHSHDFLVGRNKFISHLLKEFDGEGGPLRRERHAVDVPLTLHKEIVRGGLCCRLRVLDLPDGGRNGIRKTSAGDGARFAGQVRQAARQAIQ